jgi:hypothetical protein
MLHDIIERTREPSLALPDLQLEHTVP